MGSATWKVPVTRSLKTKSYFIIYTYKYIYSQDDNLSYWTIGLLNNDQGFFSFPNVDTITVGCTNVHVVMWKLERFKLQNLKG